MSDYPPNPYDKIHLLEKQVESLLDVCVQNAEREEELRQALQHFENNRKSPKAFTALRDLIMTGKNTKE